MLQLSIRMGNLGNHTPPAQSIDQRYTLASEPHGSGGFAKVVRGRDNHLERDIAVKILSPLTIQLPDSTERFKREARILARLSHTNIPAIYDVIFDSETFAIIFQFVEGPTLGKILKEEGAAHMTNVRKWFGQIASALDHAHSAGIVHRDIKPDNIIITSDRESAYLVDFGIALSSEDIKKLTKSGYWIGTPGYMSPEQQAGDEVDARSDIYSLGVTLYEALAGKSMPKGQYQDLALANEAIPPQIDELVRDCLEPKEHRISSAKSFAAKLAGSLRSVKPLSEVLAHGRLHEIAFALEELSADEFMRLPEGQRALILAKLADIVASGDQQLQFASTQFLELLLTRGILLDKESYREIVKPAIAWGFANKRIRGALEHAAHQANEKAHEILREEFGAFLTTIDLEDKEDWYLHAIREVLQTLLANPVCTHGTTDLVTALRSVNRVQRSRP